MLHKSRRCEQSPPCLRLDILRAEAVTALLLHNIHNAQGRQHYFSFPTESKQAGLVASCGWAALGVKVLTRSLLILHTTQGLRERRSTTLTSPLAGNSREQIGRMESEKKRGGCGRLIPEGQLLSPGSEVHTQLTTSALTNSGPSLHCFTPAHFTVRRATRQDKFLCD